MDIWRKWRNPRQKPSFGARIDWSDPITQDIYDVLFLHDIGSSGIVTEVGNSYKLVNGAEFNAAGVRFYGLAENAVKSSVDLKDVIGNRTFSLFVGLRTTQIGGSSVWKCPGITGVELSGGRNDIFVGVLDNAGSLCLTCGGDAPLKSSVPYNDGKRHYVVFSVDRSNGALRIFGDLSVDNGTGPNNPVDPSFFY